MDSGMFNRKTWTHARKARGIECVRKMGYEFHIPQAEYHEDAGRLTISFQIENRGVAPFYHAWPIELALLSNEQTEAAPQKTNETLLHILPGAPPKGIQLGIDVSACSPGSHKILLRVPNPLPGAAPVRFANRSQDQDLAGWITLGTVQIR
ncbi:hypothetical protein PDESU_00352 [Pontiella desulfatans]|uniref:DUF4832 domain-containing protein n=2 Tax=Pontiella desulfatans TaxID=2750659 RepID=A0A6C2TVW2_PONDE|nr:hypothetical protein PDESU_00352 [Pontiella desulfatans]